MKKFTCAFLSLFLILSLALVPVYADGEADTIGYNPDLIVEKDLSQVNDIKLYTWPAYTQMFTNDVPNGKTLDQVTNSYSNWATQGFYSKALTYYCGNSNTYPKEMKITDDIGLLVLSKICANSNSLSGVTIYLANDIVMTVDGNAYFTPIGKNTKVLAGQSGAPYFNGTFDGQGHSIKNLKVTNSSTDNYQDVALFGKIEGATIKNLVIDASCSFTYTGGNSTARTAALVAHGFRTGSSGQNYITNVENNANVTANGGSVAGLYANAETWTSTRVTLMDHCTNNGDITATGDSVWVGNSGATNAMGATAAGLVGYLEREDAIIEYCVNTGKVTAAGYAAGIYAGQTSRGYIETWNCRNDGAVTGQYAGGIVGYITNESCDVKNHINTGVITSTNTTGATPKFSSQLIGYCDFVETDGNNVVYPKVEYVDNITAVNGAATEYGVEVAGVQLGDTVNTVGGVDYRNVRLVGEVNLPDAELENYTGVGFEIKATYQLSSGSFVTVLETVDDVNLYTSILAEGDTLYAENGYYFTIVMENIPCEIGNVEFQLTPYYVAADGTVTYGFTEVQTANVSA